jgi:hypothetical protein
MMTLRPGPAVLQFLQQADAVDLVHAQVGDDEIGRKRLAAASACAPLSTASTS